MYCPDIATLYEIFYCFIELNIVVFHICINGTTKIQAVLHKKSTRKLIFLVVLYFLVRKHYIIILTEVKRICKEFWILFLFSLSRQGPIIRTPITISFEFIPLLLKLWYYAFFSTKIQCYKDSELSSISWVNLVAKNI